MDQYLLANSVFHNPTLILNNKNIEHEILKLTEQFKLKRSVLEKLKKVSLNEIENGLKPNVKSDLLMINTFINQLPNGEEEGDYLSIDLGSTNFRVILSKLYKDSSKNEYVVKPYPVSDELKNGTAVELYDYLVQCIENFMKEYNLEDKHYNLAYCFSFPVVQKSLDIANLIEWTECYNIKDAIDKDAVKLLQDAIERKNLKIKVVALINDASGTLVRGIYMDKECYIGMILGTGFNTAYIEKSANIDYYIKNNLVNPSNLVVIDMESCYLGDNGCLDFLKTDIDHDINKASSNTGVFGFEKLVSSMYLGEVARRLMLLLVDNKLLFNGIITPQLQTLHFLKSTHISLVEEDDDSNTKTIQVLNELGYVDPYDDDIKIVKYLFSLLTIRSILIICGFLSSLIERSGRKIVKIAVDGSFYKYHSKLKKLLSDFIKELNPNIAIEHFHVEDGSGIGAGLVAATISKENL